MARLKVDIDPWGSELGSSRIVLETVRELASNICHPKRVDSELAILPMSGLGLFPRSARSYLESIPSWNVVEAAQSVIW